VTSVAEINLDIITILNSATSCDIKSLKFTNVLCVLSLILFQEQIIEYVSSYINVENPANSRIHHCVLVLGESV
jgi:hypothetical protein